MANGAHVLGLITVNYDYGPAVYTSGLAHRLARCALLQRGLSVHVRVKRNQSPLTLDSQFDVTDVLSLGIYLTYLGSVAAGGPDIPAYLKTFYFLKENTRNMIHVRVSETDRLSLKNPCQNHIK